MSCMLRERLAISLRVSPFLAGPDPLRGLDDVSWCELRTGFGAPATEVPDVLRAVHDGAQGKVAVHGMDFAATEALWAVVTHQGTLGTATAPAVRFLSRLVADGGLAHVLRAELLAWLATVANQATQLGEWSGDTCTDPGHLAVARSVCDALAAEALPLFANWQREPEGIRFCLALLAGAAFDAERFDELHEQVETLAAEYPGTAHGVALRLGAAVMRRDGDAADALAEEVADFVDVITDDLFEDDEISSAYRARFLFEEAIIRLVPT